MHHKQLLVDVNWPNKAIWKLALKKATKDILLFEKSFLKHGQFYEIVTNEIFLKILLFFTVADWYTMGRLITKTRGQAF